jgi:hypothetical protein
VHQARTEARAEAVAAAEQRIAPAALALERAELVKQARNFLCMCRSRLHRLSLVCSKCVRLIVSETAAYALHVAAWGMG